MEYIHGEKEIEVCTVIFKPYKLTFPEYPEYI
jgi:hypothetical protein